MKPILALLLFASCTPKVCDEPERRAWMRECIDKDKFWESCTTRADILFCGDKPIVTSKDEVFRLYEKDGKSQIGVCIRFQGTLNCSDGHGDLIGHDFK